MKRPATKILVTAHPMIAVPLTLTGGILLVAGFQAGSLFSVLFAVAILAGVHNARAQADPYRAWKAEWDSMDDRPARRTTTPGALLGCAVIASLTLFAIAHAATLAYLAGYALGWLATEQGMLTLFAIFVGAILLRYIRRTKRGTEGGTVVTIIAKAALPVPSVADAYRALPPYCHTLLQGRA